MALEENKAVVRRYFEEARSLGDLTVIDEIYAEEFVVQTVDGPRVARPDRQKRVITQWRTAFPDYKDTVIRMVAEGDRVAAQIVYSGTHTGWFEYESMGPWAPTGRSVRLYEFFVYRLAAGKIVEVSAVWDQLGFMEQLGVDSTPASAAG
jgi:predicted ester cyclase